jgi:hypothetical protein
MQPSSHEQVTLILLERGSFDDAVRRLRQLFPQEKPAPSRPVGFRAGDLSRELVAAHRVWLRLFPGPSWAVLNCALADDAAQALSSDLHSEVATLWQPPAKQHLHYTRHRDGRELRALRRIARGAHDVWDLVRGEPEPWEERLFDSAGRIRAVELEQDPARRAEARSLYDARRLREGARHPLPADPVAALCHGFGVPSPHESAPRSPLRDEPVGWTA